MNLWERADWHDRAACIDHQPRADFHPDTSTPVNERAVARERAKAVCRGCEVRQECLAAAFAERDRHAIRGGMTPGERRAWARQNDRPDLVRQCRHCGGSFRARTEWYCDGCRAEAVRETRRRQQSRYKRASRARAS